MKTLREFRILDIGGGTGWFCYQLLQHIPDPIRFMNGLFTKLRPGGVVFWSASNTTSVGARLYGAHRSHYSHHHVGLFGPGSMRRFVERLGLGLLDLDPFRMYSSSRYMMLRNIVGNAIKRSSADRQMLITDGLCALTRRPG